MGWYDDGPGWGGWVATTLFMLLFWSALIAAGLALLHSLRRPRPDDRGHPPDAEQLLDERLARGEIDIDDYTRRRELLGTGH